jgi:hypothetical protein
VVPKGADIPPETWNQLVECGAMPSKDRSIWTIDVVSEQRVSVIEDILSRCVQTASHLKAQSWWSKDWSVSIWTTISSTREFVGLIIPAHLSMHASSIEVDLVFSVYCSQEEKDYKVVAGSQKS